MKVGFRILALLALLGLLGFYGNLETTKQPKAGPAAEESLEENRPTQRFQEGEAFPSPAGKDRVRSEPGSSIRSKLAIGRGEVGVFSLPASSMRSVLGAMERLQAEGGAAFREPTQSEWPEGVAVVGILSKKQAEALLIDEKVGSAVVGEQRVRAGGLLRVTAEISAQQEFVTSMEITVDEVETGSKIRTNLSCCPGSIVLVKSSGTAPTGAVVVVGE